MKKNYLKLLPGLIAMAVIAVSCLKEKVELSPAEAAKLSEDESIVVRFEEQAPIEGQYIVIFKESALPAETLKALPDYQSRTLFVRDQARQVLDELRMSKADILQSYGTATRGFAVRLSSAEAARLQEDERVALVEPDQVVRLMGGPPGGGGGGGGGGQTTPWGITRVGGAGDGTGKTAWIIDTGIDLDHPDLNVDVARSVSMLSGGGGNTSPDDYNGHGTHVAGTVGAINNSTGVVGVAANASVVSVRVLDRRGSGAYSGVIAGVDYVAANGANGDVANMSLGGPISQALDDAVLAASQTGVKFVLAAGSESQNANNSSPARVNGSNIYTVSAMNSSDFWASFSNFANPPVDYCAPGVSVASCWKDGGYNTISGTSMAAPHVAGILLLGNVTTSGTVNGDPDGNPDPIAHR